MEKKIAVKTRESGLTMIEILVVAGIIALLAGILVPAVHTVQKMARDTKQRAQFTALELGLATFKNDHGDYPPSDWWNPLVTGARLDYCGAQKLAEALVGYDLLGFHPDSTWQAGLNEATPPPAYAVANSLQRRKDRYVELETANAFRLGRTPLGDGLFMNTGQLAPYTYVLCDVFGVGERKVLLNSGRMVSPGTPILYYRANPASKVFPDWDPTTMTLLPPAEPLERYVYNVRDNWPLLSLGRLRNTGKPVVDPTTNVHPLEDYRYFYNYVRDPRVPLTPSPTGVGLSMGWPCRPDSYLLISAGADGVYGTNDDIRNFGQ
jgi:type II secretory pathway pseudopilin PulG